jgi:hypothetical protein
MVIMCNLFFRQNVLQRISAFTWPKMEEFQWLELHQRMLTTLRMLCMRLPSNQILSADSSKIFQSTYEAYECFQNVMNAWNVVLFWEAYCIYMLKCEMKYIFAFKMFHSLSGFQTESSHQSLTWERERERERVCGHMHWLSSLPLTHCGSTI